ncbi:trans-sulfuration enzyme family protein [Aquipuribacter nitratireducens]|uniref:Trans-sulfuration enzyme family protein n=1 Tax=Aquipuribacter nitratireducens TaxID=650104 RepID=A0ABW0GKP6_9MICO
MPDSPATRLVHAGRPPAVGGGPLNPSVELSSTYHALTGPDGMADPSVRSYARGGTGTWQALEAALGELEGGEAVLLASGIAAVTAGVEVALARAAARAADTTAPGAHRPRVVVPSRAYSGTVALLRHLRDTRGVDVVEVDPALPGALEAAAAQGADLVWLETPVNPTMELTDVRAVRAAVERAATTAADGRRALVAVDSTFATPLLQNPLALGADLAVHSLTKAVSGHSDVLLGAVVAGDGDLAERLREHRTRTGAVPGPFEAWLGLRGLRTLDVRLQRAQASAHVLAGRARGHRAVRRVRYPGLADDPGHALATEQMRGPGTLLALDLADAAAAERVAAATRLWVHATSLGGVESLVERRRRHPAEPLGVPEGLLRLSVGIEDVEDLWRDLEQALDRSLERG